MNDYCIPGREKTIFRTVKDQDNPYVTIDKRPVENPALSFKAKGILTYLMSRPDGWEVSITDLQNHATDGEDSIRSGVKELREAGHLRYLQSREHGRITGWLIEVYEVPKREYAQPPLPAFPDLVFPDVVLPDVENPAQVLMNLSSNKPNTYKPLGRKKNKSSTSERPNFYELSVAERMQVPEIRAFHEATGIWPGTGSLDYVYDAMQKGIDPEKLRGVFTEWAARGYNIYNVKGYLAWALEGIPPERHERQTYGKQNNRTKRTAAPASGSLSEADLRLAAEIAGL